MMIITARYCNFSQPGYVVTAREKSSGYSFDRKVRDASEAAAMCLELAGKADGAYRIFSNEIIEEILGKELLTGIN